MNGPPDWDAELYHRVSTLQEEWGLRVLEERLPLVVFHYVRLNIDADGGT